jgi:hypothetical protein
MANIGIVFYGFEGSNVEDTELVCYVNHLNKMYIQIENDDIHTGYTVLDLDTAKALHKHIGQQIALMEFKKNSNGQTN